MNCHIVPMAYLRSWSTDETYSKDRHKRKTYVSEKSKRPIKSQLKKTEKIQETTIVQEDLYLITEAVIKAAINPQAQKTVKIDPEVIEKYMSVHYEQPWGNAIKNLNSQSPLLAKWEDYIDLFLEFIALQELRTPEEIEPEIKSIMCCIQYILRDRSDTPDEMLKALREHFKAEESMVKIQFIWSLYRVASGEPQNVHTKFVQQLFNNYQRYLLIIKNDDYEFITSDFPIYNNKSGRVDEGLYFPINRNACLFLVKGKYDDNLEVIEASSEVVQFVNHLMRKAAKKILISSVPLTEDYFLETCPKEEFRKILGVE